jgi:uncharacterized protein (TIGR02284 family)
MNMDNKIQHSLNDLIEIARDGGDFYTEAAGKVEGSELSALFGQMAAHKRVIVAGLSADLAATGGEPAEHGTMVGTMAQAYADVRAALGDTNYEYVAQLEEAEDRLMAAFKDTINDVDTPAGAKTSAEKYLPRVVECHNIMRSRKQALKAAS